MCGIAGYLGTNTQAALAFVDRACLLQAHRGPDDEGTYQDNAIALGHRRLSIVDLSPLGHQPMVSPDGRWVLIYNGEIYNHQELRANLDGEWEFRSRTDTETILALLARRGPSALRGMVGMWALALWDKAEGKLLISRDRYGQKPLYWRRGFDGSLQFASEIKPLLADDECPAMYPQAVAEFLATGNYGHLGERTFFRDIYSFPPGHWATVKPGDQGIAPERYWRFPVVSTKDKRPYDARARREFRLAFEEAVNSQLMSDVPVGATLSGGLDSSAIVGAIAANNPNRRIPIFTAQVPEDRYDESPYVQAVDERWKGQLDIHWVHLEQLRLSEYVFKTIRIQEEPFGDPSIIAHGQLMDAAREAGVPVVLGGQGGDEVLFGYPHMGLTLLAQSMSRGHLLWAAREARNLSIRPREALRVALSGVLPGVELAARGRSRSNRRDYLTSSLLAVSQTGGPKLASLSDWPAIWLENVERLALPHLTHYDDRSGMARSIEGRMPFLDHRLADVLTNLEAPAFLRGGQLKRILRDTCRDLLPERVLERRDKIGFFTPLRKMLREEAVWVRTMLTDDYARALNVFDIETTSGCLDQVENNQEHGASAHRCWRSLAVRVWAEAFRVAPLEA